MPAYLSPELARECVGLVVVQDQKGSGSGDWKNPATLMGVYGDQAVVRPANHFKNERVPLEGIRLWHKGNHRLGEHAMRRVEAVEAISRLQEMMRKGSDLRDVSLSEAQAWLGNGENPLVLYVINPKAKTPLAGRLVGLRGERFLIRCLGPDSPPIDIPVGQVRIPNGIRMDQLDYNLLEKALGAVQGTKIPDKRDASVKVVRAEVQAAPPRPPEPTKAEVKPEVVHKTPAMIPMPAPVSQPPAEPKISGWTEGKWVIADVATKTFWRTSPNGGNGRWVKDVREARVFTQAKVVNGAVTSHKTRGGINGAESMTPARALWFFDMWYGERAKATDGIVKPEVVHKTPAAEEAPLVPLVTPAPEPWPAAPPSPPEPTPPVGMVPSAKAACARCEELRQAIVERGEAEAMAFEARAREARARAQLEAAQVGR